MKENKTIYEVGDRVFDINYGWSVVRRIDYDKNYPILLENTKLYTSDGRLYTNHLNPSLSFTEYTLQGFSQERPKEPLPFKVGDVVYFSNDGLSWVTDILSDIGYSTYCFYAKREITNYMNIALENPLINPKTKIYTKDNL